METGITAHGIEALVERLRGEGVAAGQAEAARLLDLARADAERLRATARVEAQALLAQARESLRAERESALAAIQVAWRDALLALKEDLLRRFGERLQRQLHDVLADDARWQRLLAPLWPGPQPAAGTDTADLDALAAAIWNELLADGVELVRLPQGAGLTLRRTDGGPELQFSDEAIAGWLMERLTPRVRRLIDGGPHEAGPGHGMPGDRGLHADV